MTPTAFEAKNAEIRSWNTSKVIEWVKSFAELHNSEWKKLLHKIQQHNIKGADLLTMDETNLLSDRLHIDSPEIRYKIMSQLSQQYKQASPKMNKFPDTSNMDKDKMGHPLQKSKSLRGHSAGYNNVNNTQRKLSISNSIPTTVPLLLNSSSSPAHEDGVGAKAVCGINGYSTSYHNNYKYQSDTEIDNNKPRKNSKPFPGYHRLSLSQSPKVNKKVTFGHDYSASVTTNKYMNGHGNRYRGNNRYNNDDEKENMDVNGQHFDELQKFFFNKMDKQNHNKIDFNAFRYYLVESDPNVDPYKLTNDTMQKCFEEFDLTKTGSISIEEFIVVMGMSLYVYYVLVIVLSSVIKSNGNYVLMLFWINCVHTPSYGDLIEHIQVRRI